MTALATPPVSNKSSAIELQLATFYVGNLLLGLDIQRIQEINKQLDFTEVPQSPACVRGVANLRGEVVTVLDLRTILNLPRTEISRTARNVVVSSQGEQVSLLVDRIADVVTVYSDQIDPSPSNIGAVDGRFFLGVYPLESELLVVLDVEEVVATS